MTHHYKAIPIYKRFFWPDPVVRFPLLWRKLCVGYEYEVTGEQNPAVCAMGALRAAGFDVDEASFNRVAATLPPTYPGGLLIAELDDIAKLCALGEFVVLAKSDGILHCMTTDEYLKEGSPYVRVQD